MICVPRIIFFGALSMFQNLQVSYTLVSFIVSFLIGTHVLMILDARMPSTSYVCVATL